MLGGDLVRVRKKAARSQMYGFEDQWGDLVIDPASGKESDRKCIYSIAG